ncbi:DNA repair protein RadA [Psittacicella hinzii]|uniref:DNA repair protein RadA n=1 Tax=Psittacicella hinzii TaxID=2028575 RepID=A0A3A1Y7M1_9GAMM|nr:DNA repair protein RadA [Psittacicella hinzii]RIY33521.1 DNA repair protein RadA [Psittacicella hinzii]
MTNKKTKTVYVCNNCGFDYPKWEGKCRSCGEYNTFQEFKLEAPATTGAQVVNKLKSREATSKGGYAGLFNDGVKRISQIEVQKIDRTKTGFSEFDRVLGGGLVPGSAILVGGHPGAGKSTILLQVVTKLSDHNKILYVTGEESLEQVKMRAERVGLPAKDDNLLMLSETSIESIISVCEEERPDLLIIDSIQVMSLDGISSSPGSVSQVRESAAALTRYAKQTHTSVIMVGHVTKEGALAGPKVLEHVIDCSLMIETAEDSRYRIIRSTKNRFGAVNEIGVFVMDSYGLHEVKNPSAIFLSRTDEPAPGSSIVVLWEGSRPLIVEIQALVDNSNKESSRRISNGFDGNRLQMLLAIMAKHGSTQMYNHEVYVNVVGGIKVQETSADLAVVLAILSSFLNKVIPRNLIVLGELGLSGELRPVPMGQERLAEAAKHGFNMAIVPASNKVNIDIPNLQIYHVKNLKQAFAVLREILNQE